MSWNSLAFALEVFFSRHEEKSGFLQLMGAPDQRHKLPRATAAPDQLPGVPGPSWISALGCAPLPGERKTPPLLSFLFLPKAKHAIFGWVSTLLSFIKKWNKIATDFLDSSQVSLGLQYLPSGRSSIQPCHGPWSPVCGAHPSTVEIMTQDRRAWGVYHQCTGAWEVWTKNFKRHHQGRLLEGPN